MPPATILNALRLYSSLATPLKFFTAARIDIMQWVYSPRRMLYFSLSSKISPRTPLKRLTCIDFKTKGGKNTYQCRWSGNMVEEGIDIWWKKESDSELNSFSVLSPSKYPCGCRYFLAGIFSGGNRNVATGKERSDKLVTNACYQHDSTTELDLGKYDTTSCEVTGDVKNYGPDEADDCEEAYRLHATSDVDYEHGVDKSGYDESLTFWDSFIKGENPSYPPRERMYKYLSEKGVNVYLMQINEINDFTKWLETERVYGAENLTFPFNATLETKVEELKEKYQLEKY